MTFLFNEDKALRNLLKDMTVTDQKADGGTGGTRTVGVWFGQPDQEIRTQSYPYITIDMIDIGEDYARAHRGRVSPEYYPDPETMVEAVQGVQGVQAAQGVQGVQAVQGVQGIAFDPELHGWDMDWPVPIIIDYQITSYARQPIHDRQIMAQMITTKLPLRFGVVEPDDGTVRRLDVMGISKRDVTENGKRLFVNAFTVRVSSEVPRTVFRKMYKVQQVNVDGANGGYDNITPINE
jgi:hypothetical protein